MATRNRKSSTRDRPTTAPLSGAVANACSAARDSPPYERLAENPILVIKADGSSEVFNREKLMRGLLIACAKRPITPEKIDGLITSIEAELRSSQRNEIKSRDLGDLVLARLATLDDVAYIRFASVYKDFQNVEEFSEALKELG